MKTSLAFVLTAFFLALPIVTVGPAFADVIRPMQASPSMGELQKACGAAGGTFGTDAEAGFSGGGYGCTKQNCDGKGGKCAVSCGGDGKCVGSTPARIDQTTLRGLLQNGDTVNHLYEPDEGSGTPEKQGQDTGAPAAPRAPKYM